VGYKEEFGKAAQGSTLILGHIAAEMDPHHHELTSDQQQGAAFKVGLLTQAQLRSKETREGEKDKDNKPGRRSEQRASDFALRESSLVSDLTRMFGREVDILDKEIQNLDAEYERHEGHRSIIRDLDRTLKSAQPGSIISLSDSRARMLEEHGVAVTYGPDGRPSVQYVDLKGFVDQEKAEQAARWTRHGQLQQERDILASARETLASMPKNTDGKIDMSLLSPEAQKKVVEAQMLTLLHDQPNKVDEYVSSLSGELKDVAQELRQQHDAAEAHGQGPGHEHRHNHEQTPAQPFTSFTR
jgi:hypothetical protein